MSYHSVSLIGTLAVMAAFGFSINTLTLFGLILAVAIVVDDAIVVVENASRLLETGQYSTREAVTKAMGEITGPIVGVVLVLLAVFIPTMLISGISGQLYKQFALTIAASTVLSGFNSVDIDSCALRTVFLKRLINLLTSLYTKVSIRLMTRHKGYMTKLSNGCFNVREWLSLLMAL